MADYTFEVSTAFPPTGVRMRLFMRELTDDGPSDVDIFLQRFNQPLDEAVTSGTVILTTERDLTPVEEGEIAAVMLAHDPTTTDGSRPGLSRRELGPPRQKAGQIVYCRSVQRADGSGRGTPVYSSGDAWRRVSDNSEI